MNETKPPFFITTAISYPNGLPHIGHAYEAIATDVIARYYRLDGYDVKFVTGTDDHGQKMFQTARDRNISPRALADEITPHFERMVALLECSNDDFIRTSQDRHYKAVQAIWEKMSAHGDIYKGGYAGWYSVRDEAFYSDNEIEENELGEKIAPNGTSLEWVEEESYFFKLSSYQDTLLEFYEANPDFIQPASRRNEIISFVKTGLRDLSISRTSFDWGVPVPDAPEHVVYVWVDALTNYLTALGYPDDMGDYWPASLHVIGKDITRFHAVYWPAFLMSAGLPLPKKIFAHGFLTVGGEKMSKSAGNVMDPMHLIAQYGVDAVRYYFMREVHFGQDGRFSDMAIVNRVNADLANGLGNLAQRSLSMIAKNREGRLASTLNLSDEDKSLLASADGLYEKCQKHMQKLAIHDYIDEITRLVSDTNRYFAEQEPWVLKKTDIARMDTVLYVTAEIIRQAALSLQPVMPKNANQLLDLLSIEKNARNFNFLGEKGRLPTGIALPQPHIVFQRIVQPEEEK